MRAATLGLAVALVGMARAASADDTCLPEHAALGHCTLPESDAPDTKIGVQDHPAPPSHHHESHSAHALLGGLHDHRARFAVSIGIFAANYHSPLFEGDYQGSTLGVRGAYGRFGLGASLPVYHLTKNGLTTNGLGDFVMHAHATLVDRAATTAGVMVMVSAPTGDGDRGFGMGHVMVMPEVWGAYATSRVAVSVSTGIGHALGGASAHAKHGGGMWPLVEPMNATELTFAGSVMVAVAPTLGAGVRTYGAAPLGDGSMRLAVGPRIAWVAGRVTMTAELAGGVLGDPFGVRGVLETSLRFE